MTPELPLFSEFEAYEQLKQALHYHSYRYHVLDETGQITTIWPRINGW